jgi:hypothetical protein
LEIFLKLQTRIYKELHRVKNDKAHFLVEGMHGMTWTNRKTGKLFASRTLVQSCSRAALQASVANLLFFWSFSIKKFSCELCSLIHFYKLKDYPKLVFRIRIRMDPHSIGRLDPDPHSECGSGSRRSKKSSNEEKIRS